MTSSASSKRIAVVTGSSSGIGKAVAIGLAKEKYTVVLAARRIEKLELVKKEIEKIGAEALVVVTDVTAEQSVKNLFETVEKTYGRLDVLFNNAGYAGEKMEHLAPIGNADMSYYRQIMATNVDGPTYCTRYAIPIMEKNGGGSIVNNASALGLVTAAAVWAYSLSKHAVIALTKSTAISYAEKGIRVNAICPGVYETELIEKTEPALGKGTLLNMLVGQTAMKKTGEMEDLVELVLYMVSPKSKYLTGQAIALDGGMSVK